MIGKDCLGVTWKFEFGQNNKLLSTICCLTLNTYSGGFTRSSAYINCVFMGHINLSRINMLIMKFFPIIFRKLANHINCYTTDLVMAIDDTVFQG